MSDPDPNGSTEAGFRAAVRAVVLALWDGPLGAYLLSSSPSTLEAADALAQLESLVESAQGGAS